jgi:hypothetical protein
MADLSDVENAVVALVTGALYPNGISLPSVVGATCRVYRGWPQPASLNSDLVAGKVNVTVFPAAVPDKVLDRYFDTLYAPVVSNSLVANVIAQSVAISGVPTIGQVVGLLVDGAPFSYAVNGGDTTESVAANLGTLINAKRIAVLSGSTLSIPGVITLIGRVVTNTTVMEALRRQSREIQANCWCPSPTLRDSVCSIVDAALAASSFIGLSDGTRAHIHYVSTQVYDQSQNALLYRRDINYEFEFTMISNSAAPLMLFGDLVANGDSSFL